MDIANGTVLIPWDFTPVAESALQHGFNLAKHIDCTKITLLHIIKKDKEYDDAFAKLSKIANDYTGNNDIEVIPMVREGSIFHTIGEVASEVNASMVVMGTHGLHGMQKLTGSWALKVIVSSKVPFIVVQQPPSDTEISNIVFPIDFRHESKEKLIWASFLSKYYKTKFHVIKPNAHDVGFLQKVKANVIFAKKFMDNKGVDYEIHTVEGKANFAQETINFATEINADLILIITTKNIGLTDYVLGASEQYIIANSAKIPTMVINPRDDLTKFASFN